MPVRDTRMMERALRERWPIKPEYREKIIASLLLIIADRSASPRERTSAAKALLHADEINLEEEKLRQADEHEYRARLVDIAKHLGTDEVARLSAVSGVPVAIDVKAEDDGERTPSGIDGQKASGGQGYIDSTSG